MFYLLLLIFLLMGGILAWITWQNLSSSVQLVFFNWHTPHLPIGLWLIGSFLLGALLLYLTSVLSARRERRELKELRTRVAELEQEKAQAQTAPQQSGFVPPGAPPSGPLFPPAGNPPAGSHPPTGPLPPNSSFIPMPGLHGQAQPRNTGPASSSMPDFRQ